MEAICFADRREDYCEECGHHLNHHIAGGCTVTVFPEYDAGGGGFECGCMEYEMEMEDDL
jgi:hypothetical protein